jgi:hypothetical protein
MINSSVLPALRQLLYNSQENLRKEACWAISNITAGNRVQIQVTSIGVVGGECGLDVMSLTCGRGQAFIHL